MALQDFHVQGLNALLQYFVIHVVRSVLSRDSLTRWSLQAYIRAGHRMGKRFVCNHRYCKQESTRARIKESQHVAWVGNCW